MTKKSNRIPLGYAKTFTPLQVARACEASARAFESRPGTWCAGALARRPDGRSCAPTSPLACKWCAEGVVARELNIYDFGVLRDPSKALYYNGISLHKINDSAHDAAPAIRALRAIARKLRQRHARAKAAKVRA